MMNTLLTYKTQSTDTTIEAELFQFELWRKFNSTQKLALLRRILQRGIKLGIMGVRHRFPTLSEKEIRQIYLKERCNNLRINVNTEIMLDDPIGLAYKLASLFDLLNIPYYIGGSVASSLQGEVRFTEDLDLIIEMGSDQIQDLINAFESQFYISEIAVKEAILEINLSFNVIDFVTTEKADIFISRNDPFAVSRMSRRQFYKTESDQGFYVSSPEDTILQKLIWYGISENKSQKQWRDILGVLKLQRDNLDFKYLYEWAEYLGVLEPFQQGLKDSGIEK